MPANCFTVPGGFSGWFSTLLDHSRTSSGPSVAKFSAEELLAASRFIELLLLTPQRGGVRHWMLSALKPTRHMMPVPALTESPMWSLEEAFDVVEHMASSTSSEPSCCDLSAECLISETARQDMQVLLTCLALSDAALRHILLVWASLTSTATYTPSAVAPPQLQQSDAASVACNARGTSPPTSLLVAATGPASVQVPTAESEPLWAADAVLRRHVQPFLKMRAGSSDPVPPPPFDPQHPQRVMESTPEKLVKRMLKGGESGFFCDLKYDGERLCGYRLPGPGGAGSVHSFYSRNRLQVPDRKLDGVREILDAAFDPHYVVYDAEILSLHTFGSMNEVHKGEITLHGPRVYVFDVLWINGHSLVDLPLTHRKAALHEVLHPSRNVCAGKSLWIAAANGLTAEQVLQRAFDKVMSKRLEGFVLKPATSRYRFGGTDWVKLKKGYMIGDETNAALPGGFAIAGVNPRVRRVDGIPVTALVQAPQPPTSANSRLFAALVEGVDCLAVGIRGSQVACAVLQRRADAAGGAVVIGWAACSTVLLAALRRSMRPFVGQQPCLTRGDAEMECSPLDACLVVEIVASGLIGSEGRAMPVDFSLSGDARVLRIREDKSPSDANTREQLQEVFRYALPTSIVTGTIAPPEAPANAANSIVTHPFHLINATRHYNDLLWYPLSSVRNATETTATTSHISVSRSDTSLSAVAELGGKLGKQGTVALVVVPVAPGRRWVNDRGMMGDIHSAVGPLVGAESDARLALSSASPGDTIAVASPKHPNVVFLPVAVLRLVSKEAGKWTAELEDPVVLQVAWCRVVGLMAELSQHFREVVAHTDVVSEEQCKVIAQLLPNIFALLPASAQPTAHCVIHRR